ncbi:RHS repeat-associated core domain-containing protein [Selenomonas sp. WCT3]|uniref:RHS repeat domain-containing protein n=1 Tax=Selenomonas sp. WCT3 TaxID=3158785 RepID=UPI0015D6673F
MKNTYDAGNCRTSVTDVAGSLVEVSRYDANSNITEVQLPDGSKIQRDYDAADRLVAECVIDQASGQKNITRFTYDKAGNILSITDDCGRAEKFTYNLMNQCIQAVSSEGRTQNIFYDQEGHITQRQLPLEMSYHYQYDSAGRLTAVIGTDGNKRTYEYDDNNQLKSITYPDGAQEQYLYTADGKLIQSQDRNGITNTYQWNVYGSLIERKAGNLRNSYEYAPNGQLTAAIANGMDYRYSYDRDGLLLAKKASGRTLLSYRYDELGRKISQTDITGRQVSYKFDKSNYLVDICNEIDQSIVKFTRDADGAIQKITHANGMWQDIAYDADKNITSLTVATPDKILAQNTYRYDGNGQRIEKNELAGKTLYTYDSLNRLQQAEYPTYTERFSYDQAGNRLSRTAKDIEEQYIYDVNNRLTSQIVNGQVENYRYDNAGNLLQDGNNIYEYDAFRKTSKVTTKTGITQINRYDAEGLRHEMEENGKLVQFIFNENKEVITEQEGENITRLIRTSDLWAMEAEPEKTWYHYASDEQGSTVFITGKNGEVKNRYTYDAFGNTIEAEEKIPNRYQYTGQQLDPITQQYYLRARFYNPAIARFTQEDEYHGDGLNLYAYCANDPVDYYDPSGYYKEVWKPLNSAWDARKIVRDIEAKTGRKLTREQIHLLAEDLRKNRYQKLAVGEYNKHRVAFGKMRSKLRTEWEQHTGQEWPKYTEDVYSKNGIKIRSAGDYYDAHEIIPNRFGGPFEWYNIHPAKYPNEHQGGIHGAGSIWNKFFRGKGK